MTENVGEAAQLRAILGQVSEAAVLKITAEHPELFNRPVAETPPLIKWLVGAVAAFGSAALIGLGIWLVSTVSAMQVTLARMDERMVSGSVKDSRVDQIERRVTALELVNADSERIRQ